MFRHIPRGRLATGLAALAAIYVLPTFAQEAPRAPTPGHYQTQNMRWARAPKASKRNAHGQVMHFSPWSNSADNPGASTSFFPLPAIQIPDLYEMNFAFLLPAGSSCGGGSPRMVVQVDAGAGGTPTFVVYNPAAVAAACSTTDWSTLDFLAPGAVWQGPSGTTDQAGAHASLAAFPDYRIRVVRINFDGGPHAWFDDQRVNGMLLNERVQDFSTTALLPDDPAVATPRLPTLGHFQSRHVRWAPSPGVASRPLLGEAMHFTPYSHLPALNFMSTSFFPQSQMQLRDLFELGFMLNVPASSACGTPMMVVLLTNAAGTTDKLLELDTTASRTCVKDSWRNLDFLNDPGARFNAYQLNGNTHATRTQAHNAAVQVLGGNYRVKVVRAVYDGGAEAWVDKVQVNGLQFSERAQDWSENALLPDSPAVPPGPILPTP